MKLIKYTIMIALVVFVALFYFNNDTNTVEKKLRPVNQVSLQAEAAKKQPIKQKQSEKIHQPLIVEDDFISEIIEVKTDSKDKTDPNLDYITAYRDWQYFANCYTDIEDFQKDRDPLQTLVERFENNPRENQEQPTAQQNMYYEQHVDICKTMIMDVGDEKQEDDYYHIMSKLKKRFLSITPKTEEAKQLAHALELVQQLSQFKNAYLKATQPVSNFSSNESSYITQTIQELSNQVIQIYEENEELTEEQTQMIKDLSDEIELLRKELYGNRSINSELMNQRQQELDGFLNSIDDYLHKIQSPDAFLVLSNELYNPEYFQKDSTVIKRLKQQTGINDNHYIRILNRLVMPLVACAMNYPCGPQSDYMMSYCLGLRDSMFNQACGKNLTDFYFNFYIGLNQMSDVDNYFNFLVSRYAN